MSRQIIIEISDDGKELILIKDETSSLFERSAILTAVIQTPEIDVIHVDTSKSKKSNKNNT